MNSSHRKATSAVAKPTKTAPKENTGPIRQSLMSASIPRSLIILESYVSQCTPVYTVPRNFIPPSIFGRLEVRSAVESNVGEGVSVDKLDDPLQDRDQASQEAEENVADDISLSAFLVSGGLRDHSEEVDNGYDQAAKTDGSKTIRQGSLECASRYRSRISS